MALALNGTSNGSLNNLSLPNETGTLTSSPSATKVGFRVGNSAGVTIVDSATDYTITYDSDNTTFLYSGQLFDLGGNFNTSTYRFTAPVTGYYMLANTTYVNSSGDSARYVRLRCVKNDGTSDSYLFNTHNTVSNETNDLDYNMVTFSGVTYLAANEYVYCAIASALGGSQISVGAGSSIFSGWLLG